jgi:hypothetical protein
MSGLIRRVAGRINRSAGISIERVYLYRLADRQRVPSLSAPSGLQVLRLAPDRMSRLREVFPSFEMAELTHPQRQNSQCYAASLAGKLVHYSWVQKTGPHTILEAGRKIDVAPGEFWIYDCRTSSSARGLGIYPFVLTCISRDHFDDGSREGVIYTTKGKSGVTSRNSEGGIHNDRNDAWPSHRTAVPGTLNETEIIVWPCVFRPLAGLSAGSRRLWGRNASNLQV